MDSHPEMKVVYMSGYTGELVAHQGLKDGIRLLEKPFTRADLLKMVDEALGGPRKTLRFDDKRSRSPRGLLFTSSFAILGAL